MLFYVDSRKCEVILSFDIFRYNHILTQTTDVEQQLIKKKLVSIDEDIKRGETVILWDSEGIRIC